MKTHQEELGTKRKPGRPKKVPVEVTPAPPEDTKGLDSLEDILLNPESLKPVDALPGPPKKKRNGRPYSDPKKKAQLLKANRAATLRIRALKSDTPPKPLPDKKLRVCYENYVTDLDQLRTYIRGRLTNEQLCVIYGVDDKTWYKWAHEHPEFGEIISRANRIDIKGIEYSSHALAQGYSELEEQVFYNSKLDKVIKVPVIKKYPGQLAAQKYILSNTTLKEGASKIWQDRVQVDANVISTSVNINAIHVLGDILTDIQPELIEETKVEEIVESEPLVTDTVIDSPAIDTEQEPDQDEPCEE